MNKKVDPSITSEETWVRGGQIDSLASLVTDATRKAVGTTIRELIKKGSLNRQSVEKVRERGNEIVSAVREAVKEKVLQIVENRTDCTKLISGAEVLELDETDGTETIAKANETFPGGLDGDFRNYGTDVPSSPTKKTKVSVCEMIKDGTFAQIFGGMSNNLDNLCLTQPQIIQFVKKYRKWLRTDGYATLFLFKVGEIFFVASVVLHSDGQLYADVYHFSGDYVWFADYRHRFVVSQL